MSDDLIPARTVDISAWIERARQDPHAYTERQATEIVLSAIGTLPGFGGHFFLKGGILMAVVYSSPRNTGDLDFTTDLPPDPAFGERLRSRLDAAFPLVTARLGYPDMLLRVQTVRERPYAFAGPRKLSFPALEVGIAYARRGHPAARHLETGASPDTISVEISFNEPLHAVEPIRLSLNGPTVNAYAITELIAEKLRAFLQQTQRNRGRRQDIYDLAHLVERFHLDAAERQLILTTLHHKSQARSITATAGALEDPDLIRRARTDWHTLEQEMGALPDFDERLRVVQRFYRSLPW